MIVYSNKIIKFIDEIKRTVKTVLSKEIGLKVYGERFYDFRNKATYPISIVVYNNKTMLGYFDSSFLELGFHECLIHSSRDQLHSIIRHELAHYVTYMNYGHSVPPHGTEFRTFCIGKGWGEEVYKATTCLDDGKNVSTIEESSVFRKIQKLMALSTSSNQHEAEQAMVKSQQLLMKHNIESRYLGNDDDDEKMFLKRIMKQKKENAKMRSIAKILETFFVNTVFSRAGEFTYLEILGNAVNIEIADYVATILQTELEVLWDLAKQEHVSLKGMVAKNSFFQGIAKGYCHKIQSLKRDCNHDTINALMVIEKQLIDAKALVYPRLYSAKRSGNYSPGANALGEKMGRQLNINPAIQTTTSRSGTFLEYVKG